MTDKPEITTLDDLLPFVESLESPRELGAVLIARVPRRFKFRLACEARDALSKDWADGTLRYWLGPNRHTEAAKDAKRQVVRDANRRRRAADPKPSQAASRRWYEKNQQAAREATNRWYEANPDYQKQYHNRRYAEDQAFALTKASRARIHRALRSAIGNPGKARPTLDLLGCSAEEYRAYLEALFEPGMTWENWGHWHIDHIRPLASFDLSDPDQQARAFHHTNTKPMWADENRSKGSLWRGRRHRYG